MSSYKIVLKPGGVGGRNVGVGITMAKKPLLSAEEIAALSAVVPVSTSLEVTVIYPVGMTGASVRITGPDAFDQTIVNTMMFDAITAGDYIIVAAAVAGHTVRVFTSPKSVPQGGKTCAMVIYDLAGTGGGGDCTPTCLGVRWIPVGNLIDWAHSVAELDLLPDSVFTEDYTGLVIDLSGVSNGYLAARFIGQQCPASRLIASGQYQGVQTDQNGYANIQANTIVVGRTFVALLALNRPVNGTAGLHNAGFYSATFSLVHPDATSIFQNVCAIGEISTQFTFTFSNVE